MKTFSEYSKHQQLVESIDADNESGFRSEDLARMVEQHEAGEWSEPMSVEESISWLDNAIQEELDARAKRG